MLELQQGVLQRLLAGATLSRQLQSLALELEAHLRGGIVSILIRNWSGRRGVRMRAAVEPEWLRVSGGETQHWQFDPRTMPGDAGLAAATKHTGTLPRSAPKVPAAPDNRTGGWSMPAWSEDGSLMVAVTVACDPAHPPQGDDLDWVGQILPLVLLTAKHSRLQQDHAGLGRIFDLASMPTLMLNTDLRALRANIACCELLMYQMDDLAGLSEALRRALAEEAEVLEEAQMAVRQGIPWRREVTAVHRSGDLIPVRLDLAPLPAGAFGAPRVLATLEDLRREKASAAELEALSQRDRVTGVASHALLQEQLSLALVEGRQTLEMRALLMVGLDHFKRINDLHGHSHGDLLLQEVAVRMQATLEEGDSLGRLGADQFVVLTAALCRDEARAAEQAAQLAQRLRRAVGQAFDIGGHLHVLSASIGVTLFPKAMESAEEILSEADTAMHEAKVRGRDCALLYEPRMRRALSERERLEHDLRVAVEHGQLEVHLQPQVDADGKVCSAEALLRWNHPELGSIPPVAFIPVAEACGLIVPIGQWVLETVCGWLARCSEAGHPIHVAVNVSIRQFQEPDFIDRVLGAIGHAGADPLHLTLELTESLLIDDAEASAMVMQRLAKRGIRFSIDDFGTGYSSLAYLKRLPLRELKIDKSFVQDICDDAGDAAMVKTILAMAHHLDLSVVAEGVETPAQAELLGRWGCQRQQGYLHGKPRRGEDWILAWIGSSGHGGH